MSLLDTVVDQATWAFHAAWGKSGQGLDAPRGRALDPRDRGDDTVGRPGEVDLEVGDGRARAAFQATCRLLGVSVYSNPSDLVVAARGAEVDPMELRRVAYLLERAIGGAAHVDERLCVTCGLRQQPKRPVKHECSTCAAWRLRKGETRPAERDGEHLTSIGVARLAKARRLARGEGWGYG